MEVSRANSNINSLVEQQICCYYIGCAYFLWSPLPISRKYAATTSVALIFLGRLYRSLANTQQLHRLRLLSVVVAFTDLSQIRSDYIGCAYFLWSPLPIFSQIRSSYIYIITFLEGRLSMGCSSPGPVYK